MRTRGSAVAAICVAAAIVALVAGVAGANRLRITNAEKGFRIAWERFHVEIEGLGAGSVNCPLTISGTFEVATFAKTENARIGVVDRAIPGTCEGGSMTVLAESLPWRFDYGSFTGTLPRITSVVLKAAGAGLQIRPTGGITCLIRTEIVGALQITGTLSETGAMSSVSASYSLRTEELLCPSARVRIEGTGTSTVLAEASNPTWRLIIE